MKNHYDPFFEALADDVRREIIKLLRNGEMCVTHIFDRFYNSRSTISYHLGLLRDAGVVNIRKQGRRIYYSLNLEKIQEYLQRFSSEFALVPSTAEEKV